MKAPEYVPIEIVLDEQGKNLMVLVEAVAYVSFDSGDPPTVNDPGSPPACKFEHVDVDEITGYRPAGDVVYSFGRKDRPEWMPLIEQVVARMLKSREPSYWLDQLADTQAFL